MFIDLTRGFLPQQDPLERLPKTFSQWENLATNLPKLLTSNQTRRMIATLPPFDVSELKTSAEFERAMLILSYLGHAYIWNNENPIDRLPKIIALPWYQVSDHIGRPPVLSYASYALHNWRRLNDNKPIALGNIVLLQNFLGGLDEEWFILIHVAIEASAATGLSAMLPAITAVNAKDNEQLLSHFMTMVSSLTAMCDILERMPEHCDPYIYFNRVRPYIHGWKDNPALPNGLIYEGVPAYHNKPQFFKGETGAQSTIIPCYDALLGIQHEDNPLKKHLDEMRFYMPPLHRQFLEKLEMESIIRKYIIKNKQKNHKLQKYYNECIKLILSFRKTHLRYAAQYIQKQSQISLANPTQVGTGGTPFMDYLRKHLQETEAHII